MLSWPTPQIAPRKFLESVLARGVEKLPSLLVQLMFAYLENTYFSADWWDSLSEEDRRHLASLAIVWPAYYTDFSYVSSRIVPWHVF